MLTEIIKYLTTPCTPYVRKMGYLSESIATAARYRRCAEQWNNHIKNSIEQILRSSKALRNKRKVLILGAGDFNDIPLTKLCKQFNEVICVDIVFSKSAKRLMQKLGATYHEIDITGIAEELFHKPLETPKSDPLFFLEDNEIDLVISANTLSQLPYVLQKWLRKHNLLEENKIGDFCAQIIQSHVDYLKAFPARACLITDFVYDIYDKDGKIVSSYDALHGVLLPEADKRWEWNIAPLGEYKKHQAMMHQVSSFTL